MDVIIKQNGQVIYTYSEDGKYPGVANYIGITWTGFVSPGISETDDIEIILKNTYSSANKKSYNIFFDKPCVGDRSALTSEMIKKHIFNILIGILILVLGITFLLIFLKLCGSGVADLLDLFITTLCSSLKSSVFSR